ncbi:MAG: hypothetical protein ACI81L_000652 [Verrucomicrobiales bacterium]
MSDVWQGPGWWLASDGKWYPADDGPGAVYEGDLSNDNTATTEQVVAANVSTRLAETGVEPAPVHHEGATAIPTARVAADPVSTDGFTGNPFAQMPKPALDEMKVGGWQAIEPEPTIEPAPTPSFERVQPDDDDVVRGGDVDGWTSAYEERQTTSEVLDNALMPVSLPPPTPPLTPGLAVADVAVPNVPDFSPTEIPDVPMPAAVIVPVSMPKVRIDDVPDITVPDIEAPPIEPSPMATPVTPELEGELPIFDSFDGGTTVVRDLGAPIEREDAWRKPSDTDEAARPRADAAFATPDVVDLAIPDKPVEPLVETRQRNRKRPGIFVLVLLALVAIGWLLVSLFSNDGPNATDTENSTTVPPAATSDASGDPTDAPATTAAPDDGLESVFSLRAGDCIVGDIGAGQVTKIEKVDCEVAHQFEVYREELIDVSITAFDETAISSYAEEVCRTALANYVPADDERGLSFKFLQPTEDSWNQEEDPDRVITCLLFDDDAPLIGRAA